MQRPLVLLVPAGRAERQVGLSLPQRQGRRQRGPRPLARRDRRGQPGRQGEHLRAGAQAEPERRDDRRGLQPAAARRRADHVAPAVGDVEVAGVAAPRLRLRGRRAAERLAGGGVDPRVAGPPLVAAPPVKVKFGGIERTVGEFRQPDFPAAGPTGAQIRAGGLGDEPSPLVVVRRESSSSRGTSVKFGSPYHASRSAKASLAASVTRWMNSALPGSSRRPRPGRTRTAGRAAAGTPAPGPRGRSCTRSARRSRS